MKCIKKMCIRDRIPVPGKDLPTVTSAWDVLAKKEIVFGNVSVIGGGLVGVETCLLYTSLVKSLKEKFSSIPLQLLAKNEKILILANRNSIISTYCL